MSVFHTAPELAMVYIAERLGTSQQILIDAVAAELTVAQRDGSVRAGDPRQLAAMCLLITQSTIQSGADRRADPRRRRPRSRARPLTERIPEAMTNSAALNASRRARELAALADGQPLDVVVIGGGITGTGIALDAASRGLTVALVEKHDLAFGTSRWSSKLVHGGLRYLATGNVGIARRSAIERGILMTRNAPHLVSAMPQLVPLLPAMGAPERALVRTGFARRRRAALHGGHAVLDAAPVSAHLREPRRRHGARGPARRPRRRATGLRRAADRRRPPGRRRRPDRRPARRAHPDPGRGLGCHRHVGAPDRPADGRVVRRDRPRRDQRQRRVGGGGGHLDQAAAQPRHASGVRRRGVRQSDLRR